MAKYILFDTETTGNQEEDKIIQIGAMIIDKNGIEVYDELCTADLEIKTEAMEVHNITPEQLEDKGLFTDTNCYKKILDLNAPENYLIAHNMPFDLGMLEKEGFKNRFSLIDTLRCARHLLEDAPYHRLQFLRYYLGLYKLEVDEAKKLNVELKAHSAISDVLNMKLLLSFLKEKAKEDYPSRNPIEILVELTAKPILVKTFKFGKHKGKEIADVVRSDSGYINWMISNLDLDDDMKYTFEKLGINVY